MVVTRTQARLAAATIALGYVVGASSCGSLLNLDWTPADGGGGGSGGAGGAGGSSTSPHPAATAPTVSGSCTVDADCAASGAVCMLAVCSSGACSEAPAPAGTACSAGGIVCDGQGACVACVSDAQCTGGHCEHNSCYSCTDGVKNGAETDVDCGGPECKPCANGKACLVDRDCHDKSACSDGICTKEG